MEVGAWDDDMEEEKTFMNHAIKVFQESTIPLLADASITTVSNNELIISTSWQQNCYKTNEKQKFSLPYMFSRGTQELRKINHPSVIPSEILLCSISPSLRFKGIIRRKNNKRTSKDEYIFELWSLNKSKRIQVVNLSATCEHGKVHSNILFGRLSWSKDERQLVYVAEKKNENNGGYFEKPFDNTQGDDFVYKDSWGEQMKDVINPILCILNLHEETVIRVRGVPDNISPAHPEFGPKNTLIFVGLKELPFRLGAIYCENRECGIYQVMLNSEEEAEHLTQHLVPSCNYQPRVNENQTKCIFLHRKLSGTGDTHMGSYTLMLYDFATKLTKTVCKSLSFTDTDTLRSYPLFIKAMNFRINYWLADNIHVVIPVICGGVTTACVINTSTGALTSRLSCTQILSVHKSLVLASSHKLGSETSALIVMDCTDSSNITVAKEEQTVDMDMETNSITDEHGISSFYMIPQNQGSHLLPVLVLIHGGPHSLFTDDFNRNARFFCKLGYAVLLVNYRGSLGFTDESLHSLPGHIGRQDVDDVQDIVHKFLEIKKSVVDSKNMFVCGGSHGGFIALHLIGQFPDVYRAAAVRNPVVDISSKLTSTDIPDHNYVESGFHYTPNMLPNPNIMIEMFNQSPIKYVSAIKTPLLLCVGGKDARVPPSQGEYLYKLMKANNKKVKMLMYPEDCHPLSSVAADGDNWINVCRWLYQHIENISIDVTMHVENL